MWSQLKESVQGHASSMLKDISGKFVSSDNGEGCSEQHWQRNAMKNVVTPKSIPQFTLPPLLTYEATQSTKDEDQTKVKQPTQQAVQETNESNTSPAMHLKKEQSFVTPSRRIIDSKKKRFDNQNQQPGLSLSHLLSTKSGFSTLTESPNTRRKESLFLSPSPTYHLSEIAPPTDTRSFDHSSSDSDMSRNISPSSSPHLDKLRHRRLLGRTTLDTDSSSAQSTPFASPAQHRKLSAKQHSEPTGRCGGGVADSMKNGNRNKQETSSQPKAKNSQETQCVGNTVKRSHSASSILTNSTARDSSRKQSDPESNPRIHVIVTYLPSQEKLNVSILEGENFDEGRLVYLKLSLLPRHYGSRRTDPIKMTARRADIKERFSFDQVQNDDVPHMTLEISSKEKLSRLRHANVVGKCVLTLCDIDLSTSNDIWLDLKAPAVAELPHLQLSLCYHAMLGFVTVEVIAARNIPKGSLGRSQDCYVVLAEEPPSGKSAKKQTKISHRNQDPVFQESFIFSMPNDQLVILATLFVKDKVKGNWVSCGQVKLGQAVSTWSGQLQWAQALDREGQPVTFWHLLSLPF
ncbi:uncharacterized protein LOC100185761 [Ciona intestinalis]